MKKTILTLIGILLFIFAALSVLSLHSDYRAERDLWRLDQKLIYVSTHKESTPDFEMDQLAGRFHAYIKKYSWSVYAKRAQLNLGDLYSLRKNFAQARLEYQKAIGQDKELSAQAEFTIAKTYESENNWDKALPAYRSIIQKYPVTNTGFFLPMYLVKSLGISEIPNALEFYQTNAVKYPNTRLEYNALRLIAICQLNQKNFSGSAKTLGELMLKYPVGQALKESVGGINLLCVTKLHDYDMAINIYSQFIQKYPKHSADPILKKMIKELQLLKDKHLIIKETPKSAAKPPKTTTNEPKK